MIDLFPKIIAATIVGFLFLGISSILVELLLLHEIGILLKIAGTILGAGLGYSLGLKFLKWIVGGIEF